ncbi:hypothetical protein DHEL01_v208769 [Diaporthe helianthi]|uniref:Uncharacterized protein n=1 Tax=Diaporthe helianthi TaxID=158607 RepID=A0A2P5HRF5_DIAHE|nr:hypothetical protein DHEL01_v208769 [Diaporthe helianthi]
MHVIVRALRLRFSSLRAHTSLLPDPDGPKFTNFIEWFLEITRPRLGSFPSISQRRRLRGCGRVVAACGPCTLHPKPYTPSALRPGALTTTLKPQLPHDADHHNAQSHSPPTAAQTSNTPQQRPSRDCGPVASSFCLLELNGSLRSAPLRIESQSPGPWPGIVSTEFPPVFLLVTSVAPFLFVSSKSVLAWFDAKRLHRCSQGAGLPLVRFVFA